MTIPSRAEIRSRRSRRYRRYRALSAFLYLSDHSGFLKAEIAGTAVVRCADNHMIVQRDWQDSRSFGDASG